MKIFLVTISALAAAFLVHWVWWRIRLPVFQTKALLVLALGIFLVSSGVCAFAGIFNEGDRLAMAVSWLYFFCFYWVAAFTYVITYSAMEGDSPTLSLTLALARAGSKGMTGGEVNAFFDGRPFVDARLTAMLNDGMLERTREGGFRLLRKSCWPFDLILWWRRRILGFEDFGG